MHIHPEAQGEVSTDEAVAELIRLREQDNAAALQREQDMRAEIRELWLRLADAKSARRPWLRFW